MTYADKSEGVLKKKYKPKYIDLCNLKGYSSLEKKKRKNIL